MCASMMLWPIGINSQVKQIHMSLYRCQNEWDIMQNNMSLHKTNVVIIGGSSGMGLAEEVAQAAVFLMANSFITSEVLHIDGGGQWL